MKRRLVPKNRREFADRRDQIAKRRTVSGCLVPARPSGTLRATPIQLVIREALDKVPSAKCETCEQIDDELRLAEEWRVRALPLHDARSTTTSHVSLIVWMN